MAVVSAAHAAAYSRRRALSLVFANLGFDVSTARPMRRDGKPPVATRVPAPAKSLLAQTAESPPVATNWLNRATFGCTRNDIAAFNALAGNDASRWTAWIAQQLDPASINDTACNSRVTSAGFKTLGLSDAQLWANYRSVTDNYSKRMLPIAETECMTLIRQIYSKRQLQEVMIDFWHDHFSVNGWDYDGGPMFPAFDAIFRDTTSGNGVFGNFETLLVRTAKSASMMYMLDLYSSTAGGPNENYSRELCELHTLGAMNYAGVVNPDPITGVYDLPTGTGADGYPIRLQYVDDDVYQVTSALSGWTISQSTYETRNDPNPGTFEYVDSLHYKYQLFFLNRYIQPNKHQQGGYDIFHWLAIHPGVAKHIATKMCRRLVSDNPSPDLINRVATVFMQNYQEPNQLQLVTQAILQSSDYANSRAQKMKRPAHAMVSALRTLDTNFTPVPDLDNPNYTSNDWTTTDAIISAMQSAGHRLFNWPAPNGYPDDSTAWASTGSLGMTLRMLSQLVETTVDRTTPGSAFLADVQGQTLATLSISARTAANIAGMWCDRILGYRPTNVYNAAVDFMRQNAAATDALDLTTDGTSNGLPSRTGTWNANNLSKHYTIARLRSMVALILSSPDFLTL